MKILIYRIGQIGDALVAVPAIRAVKEIYPGSRTDLLTDAKAPGSGAVSVDRVFEGSGLFERVFYYPAQGPALQSAVDWVRTWKDLRWEGYDALAYLAPSLRSRFQEKRDRLFFRSLGISRLWGFGGVGKRPSSDRPLERLPAEAFNLMERLKQAGLPVRREAARFDLGIDREEFVGLRSRLAAVFPPDGEKLYVACPFTAMPAKKWPVERYLEVFRRLYTEAGLKPVFLGSASDGAEADGLLEALGFGYKLTGLTIRESAAFMRRCLFYLGNDTGTMHLAASEHLPCVAVFSSRTNPGVWEPSGPANEVLRQAVDCEGCELTRCTEHEMRCLKNTTMDAVYEACLRVLNRNLSFAQAHA